MKEINELIPTAIETSSDYTSHTILNVVKVIMYRIISSSDCCASGDVCLRGR